MLSLKLPKELEMRLNRLAEVTHRPKSHYMREALQKYLDEQEWQVEEVAAAVEAADRPGAKFVDHDEVSAWLTSWGTDNETEPPACD